MKRFLSTLMACLIVMATATTVFAQDSVSPQTLANQQKGAVAFLTNGKDAYTLDDAVDYSTLVLSGADMSKYNDGFLADVKANLQKNSGKLVSSYGESLATYGAVILVLDALGEDVNNFNGYDVAKAFTAMAPDSVVGSPYFYRVIISAAYLLGKDDFAKSICDSFISKCYTVGSGMDNYGFCSDNDGMFITALAPYAKDYSDTVADAFKCLEAYKTDGGYFSNAQWSTVANPDSTALALMAYSAYAYYNDDKSAFDKATQIYNELCAFESKDNAGVFISTYTDAEDAFATKDALMGINEYARALDWFTEKEVIKDETEPTTEPTTAPVTESEPSSQAEKADSASTSSPAKKSPNTGASVVAGAFLISLAAAATARKRFSK